jgi:hypothetical protein
MVYLIGIIGFIGGFSCGIFMIGQFLRHKPKRDLVQDKSLRWTYGLFVWVMAAAGAYSAVWIYRNDIF